MNNIPRDREIIIQTKRGKYTAIWSEADNLFAYASHNVDMYQGQWNMHYFETDYIKEEDILTWNEL